MQGAKAPDSLARDDADDDSYAISSDTSEAETNDKQNASGTEDAGTCERDGQDGTSRTAEEANGVSSADVSPLGSSDLPSDVSSDASTDEPDGNDDADAPETKSATHFAGTGAPLAPIVTALQTRFGKAPRLCMLSLAGIAIAIAGLGLVSMQTRDISVERNSVIVAASDASAAREQARSAIIEGNCVAAAIPASDVADTSTTDALSSVLEEGRKQTGVTGDGDIRIVEVGDGWLTPSALTDAKESNQEAVEAFTKQTDGIRDAIAAVRQSSHDKRKADAKDALAASVSSGRDTLDAAGNAVDDAKYRDDLSSKVDAAQQVLDADADDVDAYGSAKEALDASTKACADSHDRYVQAQQRAAARKRATSSSSSTGAATVKTYASKSEAQRAASTGGGTVSQRSDGTWYVSYRGTDNRGTANADGSVSEWQDGYYIAHNWSNGGSKIASKPGTVSINGRTYRYVSSINVPRSTTWQEVEGFVHANGGIGFQTCDDSTGGYLVTHYEPVG